MIENGVIDSFSQYKILKNIVLLNIKNEISLKELAEQLNMERTHPYFYRILSELIDMEIVVHTKTIGSTKFIKIKNKKLIDFVYDSEFFNEEIVKFIAHCNPYGYNI